MLQGSDLISLMGTLPGLSGVKGAKTSVPAETVTPPKRPQQEKDVFLLSPSARQLADFFADQETVDEEREGNFDTAALKPQGETPLTDLLNMQLEAFRRSLTKTLQENGVPLTEPVELQKDKSGTIQVANLHPDAAKIEQIFKKDSGLTQQFRNISVLAEAATMRERELKSADMNNINPISGIFQYLRNTQTGNAERFHLEVNARSASYHF
ncbi:MAG: hypothetical protein LBQ54_03510 [Planctomycetaceae bacterium]|jgi:hypothetical protein|nr:hypothetical protein [Planctomycetaceae bacterium]